ncbi:uncharacterized protein HMPREF1541_02712 [Cyphellophora europaea CBS 101466]|uniref:Uncharacterized protein n=1 Tax=Cyphellophora europaea (strain CBS 101466) TaxID=1220924 RepID=W2S695_CYPE1|nr:uncharacterized protein HMPREF1541_02712 [Cyphellophora europaea CBS 101466]ETN43553.1 hypothetical protein HMPREF1541_02712 [Cyphellophora europaea CBS 101466]
MQLGEDFPMRLDRQRQVDRCVYTPRTEPIRWGTPIYFKFPEGYRKAVLGGFVVLGREVYGLTTAHSAASFNNVSTPNSEPDTLDLDDEFLESLCPRDEDFPDSPDSQGTDCASETSSSDISLDIISSEEAYTVGATQAGFENAGSALDSILQEHQLDLLGHVAYMSVGDVNDAADWALIKISSPQTSFDPSSGLSDMTFYRDVLRTRLEADDVSKVTMIVSKVEYQGYIDVSPIRIRLPGATELISVAEVHMPNFEFRE